MATWIGHLRIAENLLEVLPELDRAYFAFGSLAPDCGRRGQDGSGFVPPKEVSHRLKEVGDQLIFQDLLFYREFLSGVAPQNDPDRYAFLFGYFLHLTADGLWHDLVTQACRREFRSMIAEKGQEAWWMMKDDWYGLDVQYALDHPDSLFWEQIMPFDQYRAMLPFQNSEDLRDQMEFIKGFYSNPPLELIERRRYPYLSSATMDRFVEDATRLSIQILTTMQKDGIPGARNSSLGLLPADDLAPYPAPLGEK